MNSALPNILFTTTLLLAFAMAMIVMAFQGKIRKNATEWTRFLAMLLFAAPFLVGMTGMFDLSIVQSFWGPVFGPSIFALAILGPGFGALLLFVLSFDLVPVQLPSEHEPETGIDTDFGACI